MVTRVEYTSDSVTKVYHYTLDENNEKTKEVYREIHNDYVYTYVKDLEVYSKVSSRNAASRGSLLEFYPYDDIAIYESSSLYTTWETIFENNELESYNYLFKNVYEILYDTYISVSSLTNVEFDNLISDYEKNENKDFFSGINVNFRTGDEREYEQFVLSEFVYEFTDTSLYDVTVSKHIYEGLPDNYADFVKTNETELTFDKENTINFNAVGYELAQ